MLKLLMRTSSVTMSRSRAPDASLNHWLRPRVQPIKTADNDAVHDFTGANQIRYLRQRNQPDNNVLGVIEFQLRDLPATGGKDVVLPVALDGGIGIHRPSSSILSGA